MYYKDGSLYNGNVINSNVTPLSVQCHLYFYTDHTSHKCVKRYSKLCYVHHLKLTLYQQKYIFKVVVLNCDIYTILKINYIMRVK